MATNDSDQSVSYRPGFLGVNLRTLRAPLLAILGAMVIGSLLVLLAGKNPIDAFLAMIDGAFGGKNQANLVSMLRRAAPIVGMGIAAAIPLRAGLFNIGGEGQLVVGGMVAALVAVYAPFPGPIVIITAFVGAALAAGLYALIPAFFELRFGFAILIGSLLLNYPARFLSTYIIRTYFRDISAGYVATHMVPEGVQLLKLIPGSQVHIGILVILVVVIAAAIFVSRTVPGYEITMCGLNANFVEYGGVNRKRLGYGVMFLSGCIAGIVGTVEVLGVHFRFIDKSLSGPLYAWIGLMAALISQFNPLGVLLAGVLFAAVKTGGYGMERTENVPREISEIIQAVIIMLVSIRVSISLFRKKSGGEQ